MSRSAPCVAVVHYHLRGGGVTRVMDLAASALEAAGGRAVVLAGEEPEVSALPASGAPLCVLPELAYADRAPAAAPEVLASRMRAEAARVLGRTPDLWHIHNHALGKNPSLPLAVHALAEAGERLLLQIHDFAEDGRPSNYALLRDRLPASTRLYPLASHIHYALLNGRDARFLARAGAAPERLHRLPNPVVLPVPSDTAGDGLPGFLRGRRLLLYPTRAIRRKNLGELLLWASIAPEGDLFATTLAPRNPEHRPIHDAWVAFAREERLPAAFDLAGQGADYAALLGAADALLTTSVAEGFGLAFLEPWLLPRPLLGRNLPEITADFAESGIDLSHLYERLPVPKEWVDLGALRARIEAALTASRAQYGRPCTSRETESAFAAAVSDSGIDFALLDEELQRSVIRRARAEGAIPGLSLGRPGAKRIRANAATVKQEYSLEAYGQRLAALYETVAASPAGPVGELDRSRLLDAFLDPARFMLLRS